jgi:hypothetical protein
MSVGERVLASRQPFILFPTWTVSEELLRRAIREEKSMELDVSWLKLEHRGEAGHAL